MEPNRTSVIRDMSTNPTSEEILHVSATSGIFSYLFDLAWKHEEEFLDSICKTVVELINSNQIRLFSDVNIRFLNQMSGRKFFPGMRLLCSIVPSLEIKCGEVLRLVEILVERAGNDFAANEPFRAFRNWCSKHPDDARKFVEDARSRDDESAEHVTFALEALNDVPLAMNTLETANGPILLSSTSTALGRMTFSEMQASEALNSLAEISVSTCNAHVRANSLLSCYAILGKHANLSRERPQNALKKMTEIGTNESVHVLATLLFNHAKTLSIEEWKIVIDGVKGLSVLNLGTVESIDCCVLDVTNECKFFLLADLIRHLICESDEKLCLHNFPCFRGAFFNVNPILLGKIFVRWILQGNTHLYKTLSSEISNEVSKPIELKPESADLPSAWFEQLFLCRKVVGWFYTSPITATSFLLAVLRNGSKCISAPICEMLEFPLLLSYHEKVCRYLEDEISQHGELLAQQLQPLLDRTNDLITNLRGVKEFPELKPSELRQHFRAYRDNELMKVGWRSAQSQSVFHGLVAEKHLLYGTTAAKSVMRDQGEYEFLTTRLASKSIEVDYPLLDILDHTRVKKMLLIFRVEHRTNTSHETDT